MEVSILQIRIRSDLTSSILLPVTVIQNRAFLIKTNDILKSNNDNVNGFYQMIFGHDGGRCQQTILCFFLVVTHI